MSTDTPTVRRAQPVPVVFPRVSAPGADQGQTEGFTRGHAAGYAAGLRSAEVAARLSQDRYEAEQRARAEADHARLEAATVALQLAAGQLRARTAPVLAEWDARFVDAVVDLAEAMLGDHTQRDPFAAARAALTRAVAADDADDVVRVRLNPADAALVQDAGLAAELVPVGAALVADPAVAAGDALADYSAGTLDARLGTAVARVRAALSAPLSAPLAPRAEDVA
ncbi:FliH/SctL family protein [Tersicoccus sp. MR15.9]|uniref:FliH/SctL family protein n=1 Tax=Tersicoccus mangrovi TaxID=3121635 RepID=UPI002FE596C5